MLKSLEYNIKLPLPHYFSCLLWSKTCVARGSSSCLAHTIHCRYADWPILHDISQTAKSVLPINMHINKTFLGKEPIHWVYVFAGNDHFLHTWFGSTVTNRIYSGFLEPQTQPSLQHHFWTVALSARNVSTGLVELSVAPTVNIPGTTVLACTSQCNPQYWV